MKHQKNTRVIVGVSGGVDSSIALALLKDQGFQVTGLFMKNWEEDDEIDYCAAAEDLATAEAVCEQLKIRLNTVNFSHEYWERVFSIFLEQYRAGRTPNPDVLCNKEIKFREFLDHAGKLGASAIATGHYARKTTVNGGPVLCKARDKNKDQSYFLYSIAQDALEKTLFPLGELTKTEVRLLARELGLINSERKDSTGICFIGERRFKDFLARFLPRNPGPIQTHDGTCVGEHDGLWFYTLGQRHGLDIGGPGKAWYVSGKSLAANILSVVQGADHAELFDTIVGVIEPYWSRNEIPVTPFQCNAKIRYRQADQACLIEYASNNSFLVQFLEPQRAITPGQALVLYDGSHVIGGGTIDQVGKLNAESAIKYSKNV